MAVAFYYFYELSERERKERKLVGVREGDRARETEREIESEHELTYLRHG